MTIFELEAVGGPWMTRLAGRRQGFDELPWHQAGDGRSPEELCAARWVWTQSAFSEYASAAAFAHIAACLLAAGAPIDLVAACGDFVVDEVLHAELSARLAMAVGGAVPLEAELGKLVRPAVSSAPLLQAAELVVRTSCVGESLTLPVLKRARSGASSALVEAVLARIIRDESAHAELGWWFLDWAAERLSDADRAHLGGVAAGAIAAFAPVLADRSCDVRVELGVLDCASYDAVFDDAVTRRVVAPLAARGIAVVVAASER